MKSRLGDVEDFPLHRPAAAKAIAEGWRVLEELGAIEGKERTLTSMGRSCAPQDPRIARMILAGAEYGWVPGRGAHRCRGAQPSRPARAVRSSRRRRTSCIGASVTSTLGFRGALKPGPCARPTAGAHPICGASGQLPSFPGARVVDVQRQLEETVCELRLPRKGQVPGAGTCCTRPLSRDCCRASASGTRSSASTRARSRRASWSTPSALAKKPRPG